MKWTALSLRSFLALALAQIIPLSEAESDGGGNIDGGRVKSSFTAQEKGYWDDLFPPCAALRRQTYKLPKRLSIQPDSWRYLAFVNDHPVPWQRVTNPSRLMGIQSYLINAAQKRVRSPDDQQRVLQYSHSLPFLISSGKMRFYFAGSRIDGANIRYSVMRTDVLTGSSRSQTVYSWYYSAFRGHPTVLSAVLEAEAANQGTFFWSGGIYFISNWSVSLLTANMSSPGTGGHAVVFHEYCRY